MHLTRPVSFLFSRLGSVLRTRWKIIRSLSVFHSNRFSVTFSKNNCFWLAWDHSGSISWHVAWRYDRWGSGARVALEWRVGEPGDTKPTAPWNRYLMRTWQLFTFNGYAWLELSITQAHVKEIAKLRHFDMTWSDGCADSESAEQAPDFLHCCRCFMAHNFSYCSVQKRLAWKLLQLKHCMIHQVTPSQFCPEVAAVPSLVNHNLSELGNAFARKS